MNSELRSWSDVRVFLEVLREGSTLAASRKLGMAQPTVARRIDALEHETGLTLFDRDTRGFRPTAAGLALRKSAEAMERAAADLGAKVTELTGSKPIRVTAYTANFSPRINRIFTEYSFQHPGVQFEFIHSTETLDLMQGEADIALRLVHEPPEPEIIRRKVSTAQFTLFGSPGYAAAHGLPTSPDDLRGHRFVTFRRPGIVFRAHDWIASRVRPEQIVGTYGEVETALAAIRSGIGLGIDNVRRAADDPDLVACFPAPPELNREHLILIGPEAWRRRDIRDFIKFFAPRYAAIFKDPPVAK